jgi:hypothetical protein
VPRDSAVLPGVANAQSAAIHANHIDMVKFASAEDPGYKVVSQHLQLWARDAPKATKARWKTQDRIDEGTTTSRSPPFN